MEDALDTCLRQQLSAESEPADQGFSARVMAALPPQPRRLPWSPAAWARWAQWTAMSLAGAGLALLPMGSAEQESVHAVAAYVLIGLLVLWSMPWRFNGR